MPKKKAVCISFDYDDDKNYRNTFRLWNANDSIAFSVDDKTPKEISSDDFGRIKAVLSQKINSADYLLVIIGEHANRKHRDSAKIGDVNWINWEINKAKELGKKLVGVKLDRTYTSPYAILDSGASWAMSFTLEGIKNALK